MTLKNSVVTLMTSETNGSDVHGLFDNKRTNPFIVTVDVLFKMKTVADILKTVIIAAKFKGINVSWTVICPHPQE